MNKLLFIVCLCSTPLFAATLPQQDGYRHTGVATCATSQCHGKTAKSEDANVWLTEYRVWSNDDYHSRAFQVLRNDASKAMATALGLPNAQNAKMCLDCHADNVAAGVRGEKFQLSDGVGCEACHGGAQNWLESHTEPNATHNDNLARGLFPMSDPVARAELCLSCHLGTQDKFTTHAIMAAGHPRLAFELDTYTANQPAHYSFDDDYKRRKRDYAIGYLWLVGQIEAAKRQLALVEQHQLQKSLANGLIEFSIYDCHSCHQPMQPAQGRPNDLGKAVPVGGFRLADHWFDMLEVALQVLAPNKQADFANAVSQLHTSYNQPDAIAGAIANLQSELTAFQQSISADSLTGPTMAKIRKTLANRCSNNRYGDYASAEQGFLAMEAISYSIGDRDTYVKGLDGVYTALSNEHTFDAKALAQACETLSRSLP